MSTDRFGNAYAPGLPYARGHILPSTEDDFRKLQEAWRHIAARVRTGGPEAIFNFSGLEHGLPLSPDELPIANDFVAPALYFDRFKQAALEHFGGSPEQHDVALFNRLTGATYATHLTLVKPGEWSLVCRLAIAIHPLSGPLPRPAPRSSTRRASSSLPLPWSGSRASGWWC